MGHGTCSRENSLAVTGARSSDALPQRRGSSWQESQHPDIRASPGEVAGEHEASRSSVPALLPKPSTPPFNSLLAACFPRFWKEGSGSRCRVWL